MIVNIIHRPGTQKQRPMFKLQQEISHGLKLKTTIMLQYEHMFDDEIVRLAKEYKENFGDEIGIWYTDLQTDEMKSVVSGKEPFLWLYSPKDKEKIIKASITRYKELFGDDPICVGAYHMDNVSLKLLKQISPKTKITIGGCFEEGVKVFHGCNNSWYIFNEGMPFFPWYPSKKNSLVPAKNNDDWEGIVSVPHLSRDMALSYEGRNDFFASHPANVQRAMANIGKDAPYTLNLFDMYRFQEEFNDGFSYTNVFVGPGWLSGSPNVQDSDEVTQNMYREYLTYFAQLKAKGEVNDMYMGEFADWFKGNVAVGKPQKYFAKEILYGSGKHYFWYIDPVMRVTFDAGQGGSIGDLRPFCGEQERHTGVDTKNLAMGSNPYLIQSQYRTGNSFHWEDGARTTLILKHDGQERDLCDYPTKIADVCDNDGVTKITLAPIDISFKSGLQISIGTRYEISQNGEILICRKLISCSDSTAVITATEYFKGCFGTTEYPEDLRNIILMVTGEVKDKLAYAYSGKTIKTSGADYVGAVIPELNTCVAIVNAGNDDRVAEACDGCIFSPYYTLKLSGNITTEREFCSCLKITKM